MSAIEIDHDQLATAPALARGKPGLGTLNSELDRGLDSGLDFRLDTGLDFVRMRAFVESKPQHYIAGSMPKIVEIFVKKIRKFIYGKNVYMMLLTSHDSLWSTPDRLLFCLCWWGRIFYCSFEGSCP